MTGHNIRYSLLPDPELPTIKRWMDADRMLRQVTIHR